MHLRAAISSRVAICQRASHRQTETKLTCKARLPQSRKLRRFHGSVSIGSSPLSAREIRRVLRGRVLEKVHRRRCRCSHVSCLLSHRYGYLENTKPSFLKVKKNLFFFLLSFNFSATLSGETGRVGHVVSIFTLNAAGKLNCCIGQVTSGRATSTSLPT